MFYTYVLKCVSYKSGKNQFYVGSTSDLKKRFLQHRNRNTKTTEKFDKIELVYYEACLNKTDAIIREKQLKTGFGRGYLKRRINKYLSQLRM